MKKKIYFILFLFCLLTACSDNEDGKADDTIKLSTKSLTFDSSASTQIVTTQGNDWWVSGADADAIPLFDFPGGNASRKDFEYQGEWFHVKKTDRRFEVSVTENTTGKERKLFVGLQAGNYFTGFTAVQQAR